jgi:hypothetical protein
MANGQHPDHYEALGVSPDAPHEVIRAAYRALAAKYHPDRNPGDPDADSKLKRLNAAFQVLGDPDQRKQYDEGTLGRKASDVRPEREADAAEDQPPSRKVSEEGPPSTKRSRWKVPNEENRGASAAESHSQSRGQGDGSTFSKALQIPLVLGVMAIAYSVHRCEKNHTAVTLVSGDEVLILSAAERYRMRGPSLWRIAHGTACPNVENLIATGLLFKDLRLDPWEQPYKIECEPYNPSFNASSGVTVQSAGRDGTFGTDDDARLDGERANRVAQALRDEVKILGFAKWYLSRESSPRVERGSACPSVEDIAAANELFRGQLFNSGSDPWGQPYKMECSSSAFIRVWSAGPDKTFGTHDDIGQRDEFLGSPAAQ